MIELIVLFVIIIIIFLSRAAPIANESSLNVSPYKVSISDVDIVPINPRDIDNPLCIKPAAQAKSAQAQSAQTISPRGEIQRSPIGLEPRVDGCPIVADHTPDISQEPSKKSILRASEADKKNQAKSSRHRISFAPRILVRTFNINSGEILNQYSRKL